MENKIVKKLIDLNAYLTFECSDLTTEEYKGVSKRIEEITNDVLNMHIVSRKFKDKETPNFGDWISQYKRTTDGYYHINKNLAFKYNKMVKLYNKEFNIKP